ncbi:hypothetical protein B0H14DRAFT_3507604 [Mycena olivaceomarginata]|nr:hypothetical protein B0H14DRAFT_3507604 [Mycena olivaceomarginata]
MHGSNSHKNTSTVPSIQLLPDLRPWIKGAVHQHHPLSATPTSSLPASTRLPLPPTVLRSCRRCRCLPTTCAHFAPPLGSSLVHATMTASRCPLPASSPHPPQPLCPLACLYAPARPLLCPLPAGHLPCPPSAQARASHPNTASASPNPAPHRRAHHHAHPAWSHLTLSAYNTSLTPVPALPALRSRPRPRPPWPSPPASRCLDSGRASCPALRRCGLPPCAARYVPSHLIPAALSVRPAPPARLPRRSLPNKLRSSISIRTIHGRRYRCGRYWVTRRYRSLRPPRRMGSAPNRRLHRTTTDRRSLSSQVAAYGPWWIRWINVWVCHMCMANVAAPCTTTRPPAARVPDPIATLPTHSGFPSPSAASSLNDRSGVTMPSPSPPPELQRQQRVRTNPKTRQSAAVAPSGAPLPRIRQARGYRGTCMLPCPHSTSTIPPLTTMAAAATPDHHAPYAASAWPAFAARPCPSPTPAPALTATACPPTSAAATPVLSRPLCEPVPPHVHTASAYRHPPQANGDQF